jgi:hypothetical protein
LALTDHSSRRTRRIAMRQLLNHGAVRNQFLGKALRMANSVACDRLVADFSPFPLGEGYRRSVRELGHNVFGPRFKKDPRHIARVKADHLLAAPEDMRNKVG